MGKLRPRAGHDPLHPPPPEPCRAYGASLSLAAICGRERLPAPGATTLGGSCVLKLLSHLSVPLTHRLPATCDCVCTGMPASQTCFKEPRNQRAALASSGTCHPFTGPVGDTRFVRGRPQWVLSPGNCLAACCGGRGSPDILACLSEVALWP